MFFSYYFFLYLFVSLLPVFLRFRYFLSCLVCSMHTFSFLVVPSSPCSHFLPWSQSGDYSLLTLILPFLKLIPFSSFTPLPSLSSASFSSPYTILLIPDLLPPLPPSLLPSLSPFPPPSSSLLPFPPSMLLGGVGAPSPILTFMPGIGA